MKGGAGAAKAAAVKTGATAAVGVAAVGGVVGLGIEVFRVDDPTPRSAQEQSRAVPGGTLRTGRPPLAGTATVRRTVAIQAATATGTAPLRSNGWPPRPPG